MTAAPTPAWSIFKQIFAAHWDGFKRLHPRDDRSSDDGLVHKRLAGGDPEQMGDLADRCLHGGEGTQRVAMSGQSALGLRCAKVYVAPGGSHVSRMRQAGVLYRPRVLTVPERLRTPFAPQAQAVLSPCRRWGGRCVDDVCSRVSGRPLQGGSLGVSQRQGRNGWYNPHLPMSATSGGGEPQASPWHHLDEASVGVRPKWDGQDGMATP